METGITNGGTGGGSIADEDLPQFDDERELLGDGDDEEQRLEEEDEDGEELFGDNMES